MKFILDVVLRITYLNVIVVFGAYLTSKFYLKQDLDLSASFPLSILISLIIGILFSYLPGTLSSKFKYKKTAETEKPDENPTTKITALRGYTTTVFWLNVVFILIFFIILSCLAFTDFTYWKNANTTHEIKTSEIPNYKKSHQIFLVNDLIIDTLKISYLNIPGNRRTNYRGSHLFISPFLNSETKKYNNVWFEKDYEGYASYESSLINFKVSMRSANKNSLIALNRYLPLEHHLKQAVEGLKLPFDEKTTFVQFIESKEAEVEKHWGKLYYTILIGNITYCVFSLLILGMNFKALQKENS
jgi:hypothetical protein